MKVFNRRDRKKFRLENRRNMNDLEIRVWNHLRGNQLGLKFRRQHSIGPYIVDFYCPAKRLVVEVDGDTHYEPDAVEYDRRRDEFLHNQGLTIMRYTNLEVRENLVGIFDAILEYLSKIEPATPSSSPLGRGRTGSATPSSSPLGRGRTGSATPSSSPSARTNVLRPDDRHPVGRGSDGLGRGRTGDV